MSKKNRNITFRRIRGRIVPIKIKRENVKTGLGFAASGAAIGAGGGIISSLFSTRESNTGQAMANLKKVQSEFKAKRGFSSVRMAGIERKLSIRKSIYSKLKKVSSLKFGLAASTLIGMGTDKIVTQYEDQGSAASEISAGVAGGVVLLATRSKFARKFVGKLHRFFSKTSGQTSKLNRAFVEARKLKKLKRGRKKFVNPNQASFF